MQILFDYEYLDDKLPPQNLFKSQHLNAACLKAIDHLSLCLSAFLIIFTIAVGLVLPDSVTDIRAQSPQSSMKDQNIISLNANDAIFNANTTEFLGIKNISLTPYRVTEQHLIDHGILKNVGNVTNNKTFTNTYLSDELLVGRGKGTIETTDGQSIDWISSDLGRPSDDQWVFHGVMLFNSTQDESLSFLNNMIGLYNSTSDVKDSESIWLLE